MAKAQPMIGAVVRAGLGNHSAAVGFQERILSRMDKDGCNESQIRS